jgi:hypothetical protein
LFFSVNKIELINRIKTERAALNATLANLTPGQMVQPGAVGTWSVKDTLAHLAGWCSRSITLLFEVERGAKPSYPANAGDPDWTRLNQQDWETQRDRPLDRVMADFHGTHAQLLKRLELIKDEALLFDSRRWSLRGKTLAEIVGGDSHEHDAEHRAQVEAWFANRTKGSA